MVFSALYSHGAESIEAKIFASMLSADSLDVGSQGGRRNSGLAEVSSTLGRIEGRSLVDVLADLPSGAKVLEIGPGVGTAASQIQESYNSLTITVLSTMSTPEFSGHCILGGIGGMCLTDHIRQQLQDSGPFDVIFSRNVFYDFPFPIRGIEAVYDFLATDGVLFVNMISIKPQDAEALKQEITEGGYDVTVETKRHFLHSFGGDFTNIDLTIRKTMAHEKLNLSESIRNIVSVACPVEI